ncbi:MAG: hypothetical protein J5I93_02110 [Pirellulaceae bacterium]|nr:hypothetical protein [Pirellulaceae bacterium]
MKRRPIAVELTAEEARIFSAQQRYIRAQESAGIRPPVPVRLEAVVTPDGRLVADIDGQSTDLVPRSAIQPDKSYSGALASHRDPDLRDLAAKLDRELPEGRKPLAIATDFYNGRPMARKLAKQSLAKIRAAVSRYRRNPR